MDQQFDANINNEDQAEKKVILRNIKLENFMAPFLWMEFNCLKARATLRKHFSRYFHFIFTYFVVALALQGSQLTASGGKRNLIGG